MINIVDGIAGMEGNGPTGGRPKPFGCIITGRNPFGFDVACEYLLGLCAKNASALTVVGVQTGED